MKPAGLARPTAFAPPCRIRCPSDSPFGPVLLSALVVRHYPQLARDQVSDDESRFPRPLGTSGAQSTVRPPWASRTVHEHVGREPSPQPVSRLLRTLPGQVLGSVVDQVVSGGDQGEQVLPRWRSAVERGAARSHQQVVELVEQSSPVASAFLPPSSHALACVFRDWSDVPVAIGVVAIDDVLEQLITLPRRGGGSRRSRRTGRRRLRSRRARRVPRGTRRCRGSRRCGGGRRCRPRSGDR